MPSVVAAVKANPYLHLEAERIYNPITDRSLVAGEPMYDDLRAFLGGGAASDALLDDGWVIRDGEDLSRRHLLKVVSLELMTSCNQKCYFCPVSIAPREDETMPPELFAKIVHQLTSFRETLQGVFLQSYNEPTLDRRFVEHVTALFQAGLPVAVLSNGSGLTPAKVDAILAEGSLRYLCINLSTLDRERYTKDRGADHLNVVLRNLDYLKDKPLAQQMRIVVLGEMNDVHRADFEAVRERFAGSRFEVEMHHATDRAGWLEVGMKLVVPKKNLAGCDLIGSRPIQHLHITPHGACIICCQDYDENYIVGDLSKQSVVEVLEGDDMARIRKWAYGVEEAPDDFICRTCVFALER
ncbi:MAG TPA: radical SAM protein [Thermoanaerobaculia bacterium]|jgi:MoaA/NifB/PqqE/SkfB family radical SAM enzyme|nr:radical SAM protein [Thermoanaerobaculia bacterium]